jgi:hypothetical protein
MLTLLDGRWAPVINKDKTTKYVFHDGKYHEYDHSYDHWFGKVYTLNGKVVLQKTVQQQKPGWYR